MIHKRALIAQMNAFLDALGYDFQHFSIDDFVKWVTRKRGRPIELVAILLPPDLSGGWVPGEFRDFVFYEATAARVSVFLIRIILHELAHILLGHVPNEIEPDVVALVKTLERGNYSLESLLSKPVAGLCRSIQHTDAQEVEAETLSGLIQIRITKHAGVAALTRISRDEGEAAQFLHSIGFDR